MSGHADYLAVFVIGIGVGVACTYKYFKEKYRMKEEEEVESVKNYWKNLYGNKDKAKDGKAANKKEESSANSKSSLDQKPKKKEETEERTSKYSSYSKQQRPVDFSENEYPKEDDPDTNEPEIFEISFDDYFMNNGFSKTQLNYYTYNKVVTQEMERDEDDPEVIDDYHVLLGDVLEKSGYVYSDNIVTIYIRNEQLSADYEVTKLYASYA